MQHRLEGEVDVAILGVDNSTVCEQQTNVARACLEEGLTVDVLTEDLTAPAGVVATRFRNAGFPSAQLPSTTWRSGCLAYPSAPAQLRLLYHWNRELKAYRPRAILTHADRDGTWGTLHAWAKRNSVVGLALQEGASARSRARVSPAVGWDLRRIGSRMLRSVGPAMLDQNRSSYQYADHILVAGDAMRRQLLDGGRDENTIHTVGNPQFDALRDNLPLVSHRLRTVLFAHQPQPNTTTEREACENLIRTCADVLGCRLLIRPHPRGVLTRQAILQMAAGTSAPELVEVADQGEIADYFCRATVLATYYSASAYHACIAGLPIVLLDWVSPLYELDAPDYGAALRVISPRELPGALGSALDDPSCRQSLHEGGRSWLRYHMGALDGGASRRAATVISRLITNHRRSSLSSGFCLA